MSASASAGVSPLYDALASLLREVDAGGRPTGVQATRAQDLGAALALMSGRVVVDANRFLAARVAGLDVAYRAVGAPDEGERRGA